MYEDNELTNYEHWIAILQNHILLIKNAIWSFIKLRGKSENNFLMRSKKAY